MISRYNLIDEAWIPVANIGRVSLRQIFSEPHYRTLSGTPVEKMAITKLLLAICQAASTPSNDEQWRELGPENLASHSLNYLEQWHEKF